MEIFITNTSLTVGEEVEISCTVTNVSAISIRLLRDGQYVLGSGCNTHLNLTISVNDSLHGSQFSCEAQLVGDLTTAFSNNVTITVEGITQSV